MRRRMYAGWIGLALACAPAWAAHVDPVLLTGNVNSCTDANHPGPGISTNTVPVDGSPYAIGNGTITFTFTPPGQDKLIDWSATIPIDLVVIKGGPNANGYYYDPAELADTGLHAPLNDSGSPAGVSHVVACYTPRLTLSKTASTAYTRTWPWTISKSVVPTTSDIFTGDTQDFAYTVAVDRLDPVDSDFRVYGDITIENDTGMSATITSVTDAVDGSAASVDCGVGFPHVLADGATLVCSYEVAVADADPGTNTATIATSGTVQGGQASAPFAFGDPTTLVNAAINVTDTNGDGWMFSGDGSQQYVETRACDADEGTHQNTATITETGQSASASATLNCHAPSVRKTAEGAFDRRWSWTIAKSTTETGLQLAPDQSYDIAYSILLTPTMHDEGYGASGSITIANPNPVLAATLTQVLDSLTGDIAATVDCPALSVPASGSLQCSYSAVLPDGGDRTNTATATQQNHAYAADGTPTATGTTDYSGTADLSFDGVEPGEETDECVSVADLFAYLAVSEDTDPLDASVCAPDPAPLPFTGTVMVPADQCDPFDVVNTARFTTNDTGTTGSDAVTVPVLVDCDRGCTLTQGYWKTHSAYGPAPYDDTWALVLPDAEDTLFFPVAPGWLSPPSWYETLWTPPRGNAYYVLAHQWIAAVLNGLNGASAGPQVEDAIADAEMLFETWTPAQIAALKGNKQPRPQFISLAGVLGMYNEGMGDLGPPHCDEDASSARD